MRTLATGTLTLEPQVAAHAAEMFTVLSDPALYRYELEPPPSVEWLRQRFARLESRRSDDGSQEWLNWVIRLPSSEAVGYVQATVHSPGRAAVAYVLSSRHWGRGLARQAVRAMLEELGAHHQVRTFYAVLKQANQRSRHLLERLAFGPASLELAAEVLVESDEVVLQREAPFPRN